MGLKIITVDEIVWPVEVNIQQNGGSVKKQKFFVKFKRLPEEEFLQLQEKGQTDLLSSVVLEAGDDEDSVEKLDEVNRKLLLSQTNYRVAIYQAYLNMDAGIAVKN